MTLEEFVFNVPLYQTIDLQNGYNDIAKSIVGRSSSTTIDGYNPIQKKESTLCLSKG